MAAPNHRTLETLLDYLKQTRGFDLTQYKRSSLARRVERRMATLGLPSFDDYIDFLEVHPDEFTLLLNTILINLTAFFRDSAAWDHVRDVVVPEIVGGKAAGDSIRVWSAGCASGEEAYSLAMLFAEAMGHDAFRRRVKIYGTDVDEEALAQARLASYSAKTLKDVPPELRERYFEAGDGRYVFRADLRRAVIFGRHDLMQDAPISRLDLLVCRNTLMYFNAEAQNRILLRFHFALNDNALLFLGKAETLITHSSLFVPGDLRFRIFAKAPGAVLRNHVVPAGPLGEADAVNQIVRQARLRDAAFDSGPIAQLVVDASGMVSLINERARSVFTLAARDIGRLLQDLDVSYRPVELRSLIDQVYAERRPVGVTSVEHRSRDGRLQVFDLHVVPLVVNGATIQAVSIAFEDVTHRQSLQAELLRSNQELETANEELQSAHEELETTNEELQSTNEELETTNEELQSTNEELETMNEELQSTNAELAATVEELRQRTVDIDGANAFLRTVLASLHSAIVATDHQLRILVWNRPAEDLWGLRADEVVGRSIHALDIGLPTAQLPLAEVIAEGARDVVVEAVNRRGQSIRCFVTCSPFVAPGGGERGVILMIEQVGRGRSAPRRVHGN